MVRVFPRRSKPAVSRVVRELLGELVRIPAGRGREFGFHSTWRSTAPSLAGERGVNASRWLLRRVADLSGQPDQSSPHSSGVAG